jgi:hypothetical protein
VAHDAPNSGLLGLTLKCRGLKEVGNEVRHEAVVTWAHPNDASVRNCSDRIGADDRNSTQ